VEVITCDDAEGVLNVWPPAYPLNFYETLMCTMMLKRALNTRRPTYIPNRNNWNEPTKGSCKKSKCMSEWSRIKRSQLGGSVLRFWGCKLKFADLRGIIGRTHELLWINRFSSVSFSFLFKKKKKSRL
jgi:hypothetical protein